MDSDQSHYGDDQADLYGGVALGMATLAALIIANSPLGPSYNMLLHLIGEVRIGCAP